MYKQLLFSAFVLIFGFEAFTQTEGYRQNENDLYFKFYQQNEGKTATIGDLVSLHMVVKTTNGETIKDSYTEKDGKPILFPVKTPTFSGDIYEAVAMMATGDSASFLIPSDSIYKKVFRKPLPQNVASGSLLNFTIKVQWIKAQNELEVKPHEVTVNKARLEKEEGQMNNYITSHGLEVRKTKSGVYIAEKKEGTGTAAVAKKMISINYIGRFLDDTVFESTYKEEKYGRPVSVIVGNQQVIRGWEETFLEMKAGGHYVLLVPSHMAFGTRGRGDIVPPNTPLVFEIKVLSVK